MDSFHRCTCIQRKNTYCDMILVKWKDSRCDMVRSIFEHVSKRITNSMDDMTRLESLYVPNVCSVEWNYMCFDTTSNGKDTYCSLLLNHSYQWITLEYIIYIIESGNKVLTSGVSFMEDVLLEFLEKHISRINNDFQRHFLIRMSSSPPTLLIKQKCMRYLCSYRYSTCQEVEFIVALLTIHHKMSLEDYVVFLFIVLQGTSDENIVMFKAFFTWALESHTDLLQNLFRFATISMYIPTPVPQNQPYQTKPNISKERNDLIIWMFDTYIKTVRDNRISPFLMTEYISKVLSTYNISDEKTYGYINRWIDIWYNSLHVDYKSVIDLSCSASRKMKYVSGDGDKRDLTTGRDYGKSFAIHFPLLEYSSREQDVSAFIFLTKKIAHINISYIQYILSRCIKESQRIANSSNICTVSKQSLFESFLKALIESVSMRRSKAEELESLNAPLSLRRQRRKKSQMA